MKYTYYIVVTICFLLVLGILMYGGKHKVRLPPQWDASRGY